MAGASNDVSHKNNTHTLGFSIHYFPKDIAVQPKWTRFDGQHRGDFTLQVKVVGLMLRLGFENGCYKG